MSDNPTDKRLCGRITDYLPLIRATDGLTLGQICALSELEPSTIQNWIKRGYVPHPVGKKYTERHLARVLLIAELRESMQIDRIGELLRYVNGDTDDESDDIITEQELYDLFCEIARELRERYPAFGEIGRTVRDCVSHITDEPSLKLIQALEIMAHTYMANLYKYEADRLFRKAVTKP